MRFSADTTCRRLHLALRRLTVGLLLLAAARCAAEEPRLVPFRANLGTNQAPFAAAATTTGSVAFLAFAGRDWSPGLVPIFAVEKHGRWELRRRPGKGQENFSEPLFLALPPDTDPAAATLAGRWEVSATREDKSRLRLAVELAVEDGQVAGRFDQNSDYRFAFLTGGSVRTNQLQLRVEYISDVYLLSAERRADRWFGRWRREDDTEGGSLELWRDLKPISLPDNSQPVALHECRRAGDEARLYRLADEPVPAGWERQSVPLCRVWRSPAK